MIVATEENVLAALSSKNGDILWRRILESDESRGQINFLHVTKSSRNVVSYSEESDPFDIITVSGYNPILFRGWDINSGNLAWEWSIVATSDKPQESQYFFKDHNIYHVLPVWGSHIELTEYHASTGQQTKAATSKITAGWITKDNCLLTSSYFACLVKGQLLVLDLSAESNNVRTKPFESATKIQSLRGQEGFIQIGQQVIDLKDLSVSYENPKNANLFIDATIIQLIRNGNIITISNDNQELGTLSEIPETLDNDLQMIAVKCKPKRDNISHLVCRFLVATNEGTIALLQQGTIKWIREEPLTQISAVEFLDLTLSDAQGAIEEELNNKDGKL